MKPVTISSGSHYMRWSDQDYLSKKFCSIFSCMRRKMPCKLGSCLKSTTQSTTEEEYSCLPPHTGKKHLPFAFIPYVSFSTKYKKKWKERKKEKLERMYQKQTRQIKYFNRHGNLEPYLSSPVYKIIIKIENLILHVK